MIKEQDFYIVIGENIAAARVKRGYSQKFVCDFLEKRVEWFCRLEAGKVPVKAFELFEIATFLNVAVSKIFKVDEV